MKATAPAPADLQRWSEDVARDPTSLSFLPLARAYRKQGRRDVALKLVLRGLEQHPTLVEAHALLAMLYFEAGQRVKASDEWSMVLQLEPNNFDALRGMGFYHLEQGDDPSALRSLQRASTLRPHDPTVQEALKLIQERTRTNTPSTHLLDRDPWEQTPRGTTATGAPHYAPPPLTHTQATLAHTPPAAPRIPVPARPGAPSAGARALAATPAPAPSLQHDPLRAPLPADPTRLFDTLTSGGQILGALLLDTQGLVLAGSLAGENGVRAEELGAILGGAIEEAVRTVANLELGSWRGILLESERALIQLLPVRADTIVLLAARRETPAGWMVRSAGQAAQLARRFLETYG
jgi:tetratricopeptide (TPR) repeat protein